MSGGGGGGGGMVGWLMFYTLAGHLLVPLCSKVFGQTGRGKHCRPRSEEQSDQGLFCLQFPLHLLDALL